MAAEPIRFDDGAAYENGMGVWSRLAGTVFLDWVAPSGGLRWVDIGCGNGAFTELLMARCQPAEIEAIDPSEGQLAFARNRPGAAGAAFRQGDAMALPYADARFDAAVMALVIFFVPNPAQGVAEMVRVVRPGGLVCAYAWDALAGGLPIEPVRAELLRMGVESALPPSAEASRRAALRALWSEAGLEAVETREIAVERHFADFEAFWSASMAVGGLGANVARLPAADIARLREAVRARLPADSAGGLHCVGRANAVQGRRPG
jgi:ubiquinone/menaquinone biosynthesis C-methylase UbiE